MHKRIILKIETVKHFYPLDGFFLINFQKKSFFLLIKSIELIIYTNKITVSIKFQIYI